MNSLKKFVVLFLLKFQLITALICSRYPSNTLTPKSPVDENFAILINNNPQSYVFGQEYNISLNGYNGRRFISFSLALENDNGVFNIQEDLGHFEITDSVETRFKPSCINIVESSNTHPKIHADVTWVAPTNPESGCVLIRATLLQHRDVWHMDDGALTRRICPEVTDEMENQRGLNGQRCCACDEARYELTFQGVWNRNLHPKDFPPKGWITRFGDIIGAAHTAEYRFWRDGELASESMREYAEHGATRKLEKELNDNFNDRIIRTIIKSRGPSFPNLNGISVASVRVDPYHHLISLVSKIDPSPDWFVGVAGLELCMENCTWLDERVIQLYPWDAGTDAGPSYTSADQPQLPADVIRRIRSNFPNDPRSPFYDETGAPMANLATLTIKRRRVYERTCEDEDSNNDNIPRECYTHPWTAWSECTARCGEGRSVRTRVYKQQEQAKIYNCDAMIELHQVRNCKGENCVGPEAELINAENYGEDPNSAQCEVTPFGEWSECSSTCGEGTMMRTRQYVHPRSQDICQAIKTLILREYAKCKGQLCLGNLGNRGFDEEESNDNGNKYWNSAGNQEEPTRSRPQQYWQTDGRNDNQDYQPRRGQQQWNDGGTNFGRNNYGNTPERYAAETDRSNDNEYVYESGRFDQIADTNEEQLEVGNLRKSVESNIFRKPSNYIDSNYRQPTWSDGSKRKSQLEPRIEAEVPPTLVVASKCFEDLKVYNCLNRTVVGNFWFYNYCEDQCMLYAADRCDCNANKFNSLENCDLMCRHPNNERYLKQQQLQNCGRREEMRQTNVRRPANNKRWRK